MKGISITSIDELPNLGNHDTQILLRAIDSSVLATALKGLGPTVRDQVKHNLSEQAWQDLRTEMEAIGPVPLAEVEATHIAIMALVHQLADSGKFQGC